MSRPTVHMLATCVAALLLVPWGELRTSAEDRTAWLINYVHGAPTLNAMYVDVERAK